MTALDIDVVVGSPSTGSGGAPTGPAGGDLAGSYPDPGVAKVNGVAVTGTPSVGQVPTATGAAAATWQTPPSAGGGPPSGTASGDLAGSYPAPTVARVNGVAVTGTPSGGYVLIASSSTAAAWGTAPASPPNGAASGDLSGSYPGPTVARLNGVAVTGTPSAGQVPTATGAAAATWQTPVAGGGNVPNGTANAQVPYWNGSVYVPALTALMYPASVKPSGGSNPGHFVFGGLDNGGTLYYDKADGSGYQQTSPPINAVPNMPVLINGTLGTGTTLPTATPGLPAHNLNLRAGSNVTITGVQDATNDKIDVTIAASGGGGGSAGPLLAQHVLLAAVYNITASAALITGWPTAATFVAPASGVVLCRFSAYGTGPTSGKITLQVNQVSGSHSNLTSGTSGQVQLTGTGSDTNCTANQGTVNALGPYTTTGITTSITREWMVTGMQPGGSYQWQPYIASTVAATLAGDDVVFSVWAT